MRTIDSPVLQALRLGSLSLRNRIVRAGCFEGLSTDGQVTEPLIEHHRQLAAGDVGMTTLAYCSVSQDGRAFDNEIWMRREIVPGLRTLTRAVHDEGAAASIQLGHCGFFSSPSVIEGRPLGASPKFCLFRLSYCREMSHQDIAQKTEDFANAALLAQESGFDAVEIHAGHGYLLSQFLSPWTNHRRDQYGGTLEDRMRFPMDVVARVRAAVGPDFPVLVKMNTRDGMKGGLELDDSVKIAAGFAAAGATALIPSCGFTARTPLYMLRGSVPTWMFARAQDQLLAKVGTALFGWALVQRYPFTPCFLKEEASKIRDAVEIPVAYIGGVRSLAQMEELVESGFAFVQLGRATVRDPAFVRHLIEEDITESDCDQCNRCVASINSDGIYCACSEKEQPGDRQTES